MELTGVELHTAGVVLLVIMTVDALTRRLLTTKHIIDHDLLVIIFQATLVQGQLLIGDIAGRDESVAEIGVDTVGRDRDVEGPVPPPFLVEPGKDLDIDSLLVSDGLANQLTPIVHLRLYGLTTAHQLMVAHLETCHNLIAGIVEFKGQRGDIDGYRHVGIIRIDERCLVDFSKVRWHRGVMAGEKEERGKRKEKRDYPHHERPHPILIVYLGNHNYSLLIIHYSLI